MHQYVCDEVFDRSKPHFDRCPYSIYMFMTSFGKYLFDVD